MSNSQTPTQPIDQDQQIIEKALVLLHKMQFEKGATSAVIEFDAATLEEAEAIAYTLLYANHSYQHTVSIENQRVNNVIAAAAATVQAKPLSPNKDLDAAFMINATPTTPTTISLDTLIDAYVSPEEKITKPLPKLMEKHGFSYKDGKARFTYKILGQTQETAKKVGNGTLELLRLSLFVPAGQAINTQNIRGNAIKYDERSFYEGFTTPHVEMTRSSTATEAENAARLCVVEKVARHYGFNDMTFTLLPPKDPSALRAGQEDTIFFNRTGYNRQNSLGWVSRPSILQGKDEEKTEAPPPPAADADAERIKQQTEREGARQTLRADFGIAIDRLKEPTKKPEQAEAAKLLVNALEETAKLLDVRSDEQLAKAGYEPEELATIGEQVKTDRFIRDMLLSDKNIIFAAKASGLLRQLSPNEPDPNKRQDSFRHRRANEFRKYFTESLPAAARLDELANHAPGMPLLIQALMLPAEKQPKAATAYVEQLKNILAKKPDIGSFENFLGTYHDIGHATVMELVDPEHHLDPEHYSNPGTRLARIAPAMPPTPGYQAIITPRAPEHVNATAISAITGKRGF